MSHTIRLAMIAALTVSLSGCIGSDSDPQPAPIGSKTLTFYGRPNEWAYCDGADVETVLNTMRQEARAMKRAGWDGGQIELWGWVRYSRMSQAEAMERIRIVYPAMIEEYRRLGLWLYVSGANDNQGLGKWGDPGRSLSADWKYLEECLALIVEHGPENVIAQPVCETKTGTGRKLELLWAETLKPLGIYMVDNHNSRPTKPQPWADSSNYHPWGLNIGGIDPSMWVNNDTMLAIRAMTDGDEYGPSNPATLAAYIAQGRSVGFPAVMVYAWGHPDLDLPAIEALNGVTP